MFCEDITTRIKVLISLDELKKKKCDKRSWVGTKSELVDTFRALDDRASCAGDGRQKLIDKVESNIKDAIRRQMNMMHFFVDDQAEYIIITTNQV